ncbi:hypothetical protein ASPVEDRAFT_83294 [Aspergillus versicolor CBS 583.65]|uniref:Beta-lactamase-related domain-containing protein n=1 Tax=Aspergillus versicolor CBS 583.65 TaxID=1036611 RepID=A0A1L9PK00_ASPVE|nr:uncharacterized protein ASPVEDRAFT_83294 [Aspergillus versicolor CBS 583.65]OJJ01766.1 hypothetical protein ASPVEDRAFT_83294 [Aspergillus versicolor CBS 583.65]
MSCNDDPRIQSALSHSLHQGEIGIAVAAYHRGELIVNTAAGVTNSETKEPVDAKTLFPVFSVTKGVTALAIHIQAERGHLHLETPISTYWPEFSANGKHNITVEDALSHRSGIPKMPATTPQQLADWNWMVKQVAQQKPQLEPGRYNAYHILVWGWILGEVVVRTDPKGRQFEQFIQEEICSPLGVTDFYLGVPDGDLSRVATLYGGESFGMVDDYNACPPGVYPSGSVHNQRIIQQAVDPGAGAVATPGSIARIFALIAQGGTLDGVRLLSPERVASLTRPRKNPHDQDKVLPIPVWFGAAGFWLGGQPGVSDPVVGAHRDIIYSPGAGNNIAWADLRDQIAVSICHNNMDVSGMTEQVRAYQPVVDAVRAIIADRQEAMS